MRQALHRVLIVVGFLVASGAVEIAACPNAEASYGFKDALETVGISAGIGAVLGLSTIAFYDSPFSHMQNALVGMGAGMVVGLGVAAYLVANSDQDNEISPDELLPPENKPKDSGKKPDLDPAKKIDKKGTMRFNPSYSNSLLLASVPTTSTLTKRLGTAPGWAVAVKVLELRF